MKSTTQNINSSSVANTFDSNWINGQTSFIPEYIKPSWRRVYKHLRLTRGPDAANQFLMTHATSVLTCNRCGLIALPIIEIRPMLGDRFHVAATCPDCNEWIKWLKFGGGNHG